MKHLLLFTVLFLSINTSIQGSVCDKVCFDELREHFSRFAGYSTFTKRFKGPRFWTWKEEEAYVDAKTDEGKKRRQEFDDGFERAELRSDKEYCRSNGLEEAREKVVGELRESDAREHALDVPADRAGRRGRLAAREILARCPDARALVVLGLGPRLLPKLRRSLTQEWFQARVIFYWACCSRQTWFLRNIFYRDLSSLVTLKYVAST